MHHPAPRRPAVVPDLRRLARVLPLGCVLALGAALPAQPPPDAPPLGDPEGVPRLARAVERHGITWHFDRELVVGAFANGDPWVVGPATVERIEPACDEVGGRVLHGSMVDPDPSAMLQGYDSALFGEDGGARYDAARNVARGLSPERPLVLPPGASLVSVESRPEAGRIPSLRRASVLTVVESVPAPDGFRPPYVAGDKRMPHRAADLDFTALARLAPVGDLPLIESLAAGFDRLWLDHFPAWVVRYAHPGENMPDYGRDLGAYVGSAALMLNLDLPDARKRDLLVRFVQYGIDLHAALRGGCRWQGIGGHGHGRKLPILVAGLVLRDERMLAIGEDYRSTCVLDGGKGAYFAEDGQTFFVRETSPGVFNWGHGGYTAEHAGLAEWGFSHADHPNTDNVAWDSNDYRLCCSANAWTGQALAARILGLQDAWAHPAWFEYVDRYQQTQHREAWHRSWVGWHTTMWSAYRSNH